MTKIETEKVNVNSSQQDLYDFLIDFNHFERLLPADKIENWTSDGKSCSFRIKGMADIGMAIEKSTPNSEINIVSHGKVPFPFRLDVYLNEVTPDETSTYMVFSGEINPFMKMMVEKPLTNFFNMIVKKLAELHG